MQQNRSNNGLQAVLQLMHCPDFIDAWSPNSLDLNPLDCRVCGRTLDKVNRLNSQPKNIPGLKTALLVMGQAAAISAIRKSIVSFRKRLRDSINAKGGHFEHTLYNSLVNLVIDFSVFNN